MRRFATGLVVLALSWGDLTPRPLASDEPQAPALSADKWREDLRYFAKELPRRHKNLYHATSREQFERAVAELDRDIPSLAGHQVIIRIAQITAMVGDGHTGIHIPPYFKRYPIALYWFGNALRVVAAADGYEKALGTRVVKIGAVDIDEAQRRVESCFPSAANENPWYVLSTSAAFLVYPEVLHTLGIVSELDRAPFTLEDDQGAQFTLEIRPVAVPRANGVPTLRMNPAAKATPLYRQKMGEKFWFTYLPDSKTVYVSFRGYASLGDDAKKLFKFIDDNPTSRLIVDMRQNGGGDFFVGRKHLIRPVKERPALNAKGHLYVIVGRQTFSAALANAVDFRKETNAILVGEPIGERPNSYSENDEMTLPNSRLVVSYSTKYYQFVDQDVPAVMPDMRIDPNWGDFLAGRDPVVDWILSASSGQTP